PSLLTLLIRRSTRIILDIPLIFFFKHTPPPSIYTLSLHDALPILFGQIFAHSAFSDSHFSSPGSVSGLIASTGHSGTQTPQSMRSEEHTSELQSRVDIVCRLLLEKKNKQTACTE